MKRADPAEHASEPGTERGSEATYRSGAAARLAGIPVETLRVWERRYGVVGPQVSSRGQRLYTSQQVRRLGLVKKLVDLGNPISVVASLSDDAVAEMLAAARAMAPPAMPVADARPIRTALVGESFAASFRPDLLREAGLDVIATCRDVQKAPEALRHTRPEVIVIEVAALLDSTLSAVAEARETVEAAAVVLYQFGQREAVARLRADGYVVSRTPLDSLEMGPLCRAALTMRQPREARSERSASEPRAARFDEDALARLARASSTVFCECPSHLAELLRILARFERYSALCESRSPADAELHRDLRHTAGEARLMLEDALVRVAMNEGLPLPQG